MSLDLVRRATKGLPLTSAEHDSNLLVLEAARAPDNWMIIHSVDDLPDPVGDQVTLPANKIVLLSGALNLGSDALRLSAGTVLRGAAGDSIMSSNASGVVRATNLAANIVMREFSIIATGGPAVVLEGTIDYQLNMFFMGLIGASAGTIDGFDVQAVKSCYVNAVDGFTFGGTTNKVFVDSTPFYGITGSAIRFAADLNANVADIVTNFFKFNSPGVGVEALSGHSIGEGRLRGNLRDGTAVPLVGITASDVNWFMRDNSGIEDSRILAELSMDGNTTATTLVQDTWTKVAGTSTAALLERFDMPESGRLRYLADRRAPAAVHMTASVFGTANNQVVQFALYKNGAIATPPMTSVLTGSGSARADVVSLNALFDFTAQNDYVEVWMRCTSGSNNATVASLQLTVQS